MEKYAHFQEIIQAWKDSSDEINGVALFDKEGVPLASTFSSMDVETLGTVVASTLKVGQEGLENFGRKEVKQLLLKTKDSFIILKSIGKKGNLLVLANETAQPQELLNTLSEVDSRLGE